MKIVTNYDFPPVPDRSMDWSAIDDDTYDGAEDAGPRAHLIGRGPTEEAAIADLKAVLAEHDICESCGAALTNDRCEPCDTAREVGEKFAAEHGMPWERGA